jgi:hypothetical protein
LSFYSALLDQWKQADPNLLELREARDFVNTKGTKEQKTQKD